jgi:hypothetical protein
MTKDEIIEMARRAGWEMDDSCVLEPEVIWYISQGQLEAFAKLVAEHERKECAKLCEDNAIDLSERDWDSACLNCSDHIRARGEA